MIEIRRILALALVGFVSAAGGQQGHTIGSNQVTIEGRDHFENWVSPVGTSALSDDGGVQPRKLRRHTNAMLSIAEFLRERPPAYLTDKAKEEIVLLDAIEAVSNRQETINIFDGDMSTWWEPAPLAGHQEVATQWWFTVDLGRVVLANRIVVKFAPEGAGDPFLRFDVLTSDGQKPSSVPGGADLEFLPVLQTLEPNRTQREFEIDLSHLAIDRREQVVRYVQVVVRASALERGREVGGEEAYLALDSEDRGLIEYTKLVGVGSERVEYAVSREKHALLEGARRGPIRYFRRERPRLAELEVWGDGDEIVRGTIKRGGSFIFPLDANAELLIDGNVASKVLVKTSTPDVGGPLGNFFVDLGSSYWIDAQRMITNFRGSEHALSFSNYQLDFSDGRREADGSFAWHTAATVEQPERGFFSNSGELVLSNLHTNKSDFDPVRARFFQLLFESSPQVTTSGGAVNLAELQLFGSGYQLEVWLESDPIVLPGNQNLTEISWEADTPPGTEVVLQTKTGNVLLPDTLYYLDDNSLLGRGEEGSKKYYGRAFKSRQGDKVVVFEEGPGWSPLSETYEDNTGSAITSPAPRQIVKIRATLRSDTPDTAATLRSIVLNFSDPVARRLLGEVTPTRVEALGVEGPFSLYVGIDTLELGFDELLVRAPSGMVIGEDDGMKELVQLFTGPASDSGLTPHDGIEVLGYGDSLHVSFPTLDAEVKVVRLDFPAILYSAGGMLEASLRNSDSRFWQRVDVGNAVDDVAGNTLLVVAQPQSKELFSELKIIPPVATPNDDGINDELVAEFTVVLLGDNETIEMEIFDLSGHLVRRLTQNRQVSSGRYRMAWDGLDEHGELAPPGLYAVRLGLDSNTDGAGLDKERVVQTIALLY